jgi:glycosyltransferase involved in cell wall biosynthesis
LVESLAAGTPVVAGDCDFGPREVLAGAEFSRVVPRERDALARALAEVLDEQAEARIEQESRQIAGRYRSERIAPLVEEAFAQALASRR